MCISCSAVVAYKNFQRIQEVMPNIGLVRSFGVTENTDVNSPDPLFYIEGDNGGVRFPIDAVRAEDLAEMFDDLADELAVEG
ncbi:hypothetical protein SAMN04488063_1775 [Halopelagius inordinatus]|uniref:Uncharacterized protein n=2 Tax=Halopelagius inordinatus TaxID=553467 RepID=A0A1I2R456_9EURY|nr:hypothetical protein SAMN04488063_1775 [Halopelagius inordinatus]